MTLQLVVAFIGDENKHLVVLCYLHAIADIKSKRQKERTVSSNYLTKNVHSMKKSEHGGKTSTWCRKPVCYDELKDIENPWLRHQAEFLPSTGYIKMDHERRKASQRNRIC